MSTTALPSIDSAPGVRCAGAVLGSAREARLRADAAEVQVLVDAVEWAVLNPPLFGREAAAWYAQSSEGTRPDRAELSAQGVPDVDRAAVAELGAALGVSTQSAQALVGDALELAYRLPTLWTRVVAGEVKPWRARRVAQATRRLSGLAAGFVDRAVAPVAQKLSGLQLDGLIETAMARHDKDLAERLAAERAEQRGFDILLNQTNLAGLTPVTGLLDLPDALDLEAAVSHGATQLATWGSGENRDVRRARAVGDLARDYLAFVGEPGGGGHDRTDERDRSDAPSSGSSDVPACVASLAGVGRQGSVGRTSSKRQVMLYVHLTETTILSMVRAARDADGGGAGRPGPVRMGRVENTGSPVTAETIRDWCGDLGTKVTVRPVLDLNGYQHAGSYEVPTRIKEQIRLRDGTCVFPGCFTKGLSSQVDHTDPYDHDHPEQGGHTETSNLALLCQLHHNLKTHHGFRYAMLANGAVLWRTPHGLSIRRNRDGTLDYLTRYRARSGPRDGEPDPDSGDDVTSERGAARRAELAELDAFDGFIDLGDFGDLEGVDPPDT